MGMNRQRVHAAGKFRCENLIYQAVALDPALAFEDVCHNMNAEMALAARAMAGMSRMVMRFVLHTQACGRKHVGQFRYNCCVHGHGVDLVAASGVVNCRRMLKN